MSKVPLPPVILNSILRYVLMIDSRIGNRTPIHDARDTPMYWKIALTSKQFLHALVLEYRDITPIGPIRVATYDFEYGLTEYSSIEAADTMYGGLVCFYCSRAPLRKKRRNTPYNNIGTMASGKIARVDQIIPTYASYREQERQYTDILCTYCVHLLWTSKVRNLRKILKK